MTDAVRTAGRIGPHVESHEPRLLATKFIKMTLGASAVPLSGYIVTDVTHDIINWGMDDNDRLGCCGFAAVDHGNVAKLGDATQAGWSFFPQFKSLAAAYFAYGLAQGEVGPPDHPDQPDQGVSNALMLGWLYKMGEIDGYAEVPLDQLDWFVDQFKGVITGLVINDNTAQHDFEVGAAWDTMMNRNAGHDVLTVKTNADGSGEMVTWGALQKFTVGFRNNNITDAWVIFDKDDPYVDWDALEAVLTEIHGVVNPIQPIPDPTPAASSRHESIAHRLHSILGRALSRETEDVIVGELQTLVQRLTGNRRL